MSLQWRHYGCDGVSHYQPHKCLPNRLFRRRSKAISKLLFTGLCEGNLQVKGEFPAQMACNAENASILWRHHVGNPFSRWFIFWWATRSANLGRHRTLYDFTVMIFYRSKHNAGDMLNGYVIQLQIRIFYTRSKTNNANHCFMTLS